GRLASGARRMGVKGSARGAPKGRDHGARGVSPDFMITPPDGAQIQNSRPDASSRAPVARWIGPSEEPLRPRSKAAAPIATAPRAMGLRTGCHSKILVYQLVEREWPL